MLVLGSISYVPNEPCPSVSSAKRLSLLSLGGFGNRCLQGYLGSGVYGMVEVCEGGALAAAVHMLSLLIKRNKRNIYYTKCKPSVQLSSVQFASS